MASSRSSSAVVPAWLASPGDVDAPAAVRPDVAADSHGVTEVDERVGPARRAARRTSPTRASVSSSRPRCVGSLTRPAHRLRHRHAVAGPRARGPGRRPRAPVMTREPAQATPNLAPSSSVKLTTPTGRCGWKPPCAQEVDGGEGTHHAERAVEGPAVRHRVEVRADDDPRVAGGDGAHPGHPTRPTGCPSGRSSGRDRGRSHSAGEPLAQVVVLAGPGEAVVAPGVAVHARSPPRHATSARNAEAAPPLVGVVDMNPLHQVEQGCGAHVTG